MRDMLGTAYLIRLLYAKDDPFVLKSTIAPFVSPVPNLVSSSHRLITRSLPSVLHLYFPKEVGKISLIK